MSAPQKCPEAEVARLLNVVHALEVLVSDLTRRVAQLESERPRRRRPCGQGDRPPECMGMAARGICTCVGEPVLRGRRP